MSLQEIASTPTPTPAQLLPEVDYEALPDSAPLSHQLLAGAFAGIMEHCVLYPIDAIKTRIQSATALKAGSDNLVAQIARISTAEGSLALWRGVQSVILGAGPAHAVYFATYEYAKEKLIAPGDINSHQPLRTAAAGAMATIAADALMNPFDTIKQRIQLNTSSSVWQLARDIYVAEGPRAFYLSYPTTLAMNVPFAACNFMIYESATKFLNPTNEYNPLVHCLCGGISGAACAAITTPLDCVKTVLQVKGSSSVELAAMRNADTFAKASAALYQTYGARGFWRGLKPRVVANMPATAISWTAYECAKHFLIKK
ncbi:Fe(2+) transporter [Maudiozyma humilis]|uniref:Fe(2+) transporter n=1 Tax=Maudiozyma humilis TaxID=51915 RepID=A0AAV5RTJ3_MAUHU|nr:Fe(2+) transporter [Kazachstania humilis]